MALQLYKNKHKISVKDSISSENDHLNIWLSTWLVE